MDRRFLLDLSKDWGLALALTLVVFLGWTYFSSSQLSAGEAPEFTLQDAQGHDVSLSAQRGHVVILNFWATWCGPCVAEIPELIAFSKQHPDVPVLGVSLDRKRGPGFVHKFAQRKGVNYPVLHDAQGRVGALYGVNTLPTTYVIGADGHIVTSQVGAVTANRLELMLSKGLAHADP